MESTSTTTRGDMHKHMVSLRNAPSAERHAEKGCSSLPPQQPMSQKLLATEVPKNMWPMLIKSVVITMQLFILLLFHFDILFSFACWGVKYCLDVRTGAF